MIVSLPDVNIWISLAAEGHIHHVPARDWFTAQLDASVAFGRITQMGLLRLLTNSHAMGRAPRTVLQTWETFEQLRADRRLVFATEPDHIESAWRQLMTETGIGPSSWTDAYLAAFAEAHSYSLVTFDTGFERVARALIDASFVRAEPGQLKRRPLLRPDHSLEVPVSEESGTTNASILGTGPGSS